jgi:HPt (histidine-containing phosphotransfer) domain-containing protein
MPEQLYNLNLVKKLSHNNLEVINKLIHVFIEQAPSSVNDIKSAYYSRKYSVVTALAHKIKPTYGYFSVLATEKDLEMIEKLSTLESPSAEIEEMINRVEDATSKVVAEMKSDLN